LTFKPNEKFKEIFIISSLKTKLISTLLCIALLLTSYIYAYAQNSDKKDDTQSTTVQSFNDFDSLNLLSDENENESAFEIKVKKVTQTSATLVWNSETVYIGYSICKYNPISDTYDEVATTSSTSYVIKKLTQNTSYDYCVKSLINNEILGTVTFTTKKKPVAKTIKMGLPSVSGSTKTYAYYTAVTAKSSPQYKLLNSDKCYTDEKTGIRMVDGYYCIALGSYYGSTIGTKYKITLSSGKSFKAILCDQKANRHTDSNNQYAVQNKDIVEFYVEKSKIPSNIRGDYGTLEQFKGSIVSIEKYV
jgi:hypothetical protein